MLSTDVVFWATRFRQWLWHLFGLKGSSFEDELEKTMRSFAKSNFGIDVPETVFDG